MNVVGVDIGFGFTKATNGKDTLVFKSIFGEATDIQFREQLLSAASPEEHLHLELDGESFFVGELAERQSHVRSFTLDQNQFITNFAKIMAMAALSRLASANDSVSLVTGLPVSFYRRHREELSGLLLGDHSMLTMDSSGARAVMPVTWRTRGTSERTYPGNHVCSCLTPAASEITGKNVMRSRTTDTRASYWTPGQRRVGAV